MRKRAKIASLLMILLLALLVWLGVVLHSNIPENSEQAIKAFYEDNVAEDQIMDPLILAGPNVIPLLQQDLQNPNMPRRRYAIGALGNISDKSALPVLEKLAHTKSEVDYIRCDALGAIAMIDREHGLRVAKELKGEQPACLLETAQYIQRDYTRWLKTNAPRRTYLQALLGRHG